ncbi:MAG: hypothetical protein JNL32_00325 [Candidatus Kapabacteria bacterium]|nr:hypothetical protein [Candidatus Kapabacteria bacterium]
MCSIQSAFSQIQHIYWVDSSDGSGYRDYQIIPTPRFTLFTHELAGLPGGIYITDGTTQGTFPLIQTQSGVVRLNSTVEEYGKRHAYDSTSSILYFTGDSSYGRHSVWATDGTERGTYRVHPLVTGTYIWGNRAIPQGVRVERLWLSQDFVHVVFRATGDNITEPYVYSRINKQSRQIDTAYVFGPIKQPYSSLPALLIQPLASGTVMATDSTLYFFSKDGVYLDTMRASTSTLISQYTYTDGVRAILSSTQYVWGERKPLYSWMTDGTKAGTSLIPLPLGEIKIHHIANGYGYGSSIRYNYSSWDLLFHRITLSTGQNDTILENQSDAQVQNSFRILRDSLIVFRNQDPLHGCELWVWNIKTNNIEMLKDINPYITQSSMFAFDTPPCSCNNRVYMFADDGVHGKELYETDGTAQGTRLVEDMHDGAGWTTTNFMICDNNQLYFFGFDGKYDYSLYRYNTALQLRGGTSPSGGATDVRVNSRNGILSLESITQPIESVQVYDLLGRQADVGIVQTGGQTSSIQYKTGIPQGIYYATVRFTTGNYSTIPFYNY